MRLFGEKRIPKDEFYSFFQIIMFINGYILTKVGPDHLAVVLIQSLAPSPQQRTNLRNEAIYVLPDELDEYADQVATQVITVLHLPHTDVRTLGNSLRGLTSADPSGQQGVIPVGNTNSVILSGFASNVASMARILKLVDEESARDTSISPVFEVLQLEFAAAEDLADILEQLLDAQAQQEQARRNQAAAEGATGQIAGRGGETKILTDTRTNSLLVMALPDDMTEHQAARRAPRRRPGRARAHLPRLRPRERATPRSWPRRSRSSSKGPRASSRPWPAPAAAARVRAAVPRGHAAATTRSWSCPT